MSDSRSRRRRSVGKNAAYGILTVISLGLVWQLSSSWHVYNSQLIPPPSDIARAFGEMIKSGEWGADVADSLQRYAAGFLLGGVAGIILGLLTGRLRMLRACLAPIMNLVRNTPLIALVPLFIVIFGIGLQEKVMLVAWGVVFPVWINTEAGVGSTEKQYIWAARSLGASGWRLYREVLFPGALPSIISGVRIAIATGFFALGAAEVAGAFSGIVFRAYYAHQMFRTDKMMVAILTIGLLGVTCDRLYVWTMARLVPWWKDAHYESN